jgi:uncharacterized membrane protein YeaQ/YmgE (transglycosylase-associated protein family)
MASYEEGATVNIILWIIFGALAGWIASLIMGTNRQQGCLMDIVVGVVGAFLGGLVFSLFGGQGVTGFNIYSLLVAVLGAVILLWIVGMVRRKP